MKKILSTIFLIFLPIFSYSYQYDFQGQLISWVTSNKNTIKDTSMGFRYIPSLHTTSFYDELDAEMSFNAYSFFPLSKIAEFDDNAEIKPYRIWVRYQTEILETRIGLQKINFGPAIILRSLMWFDSVDVRDPLGLTDGVDAGLLRYYFLNNANIWFWVLYGNDDTKGLEIVRTAEDTIEVGGRYQFPVKKGEMALTYHRRFLDKDNLQSVVSDIRENRYALDGMWDVGVGLWFETAVFEREKALTRSIYRKFYTFGMDYTFSIGRGLHVLTEYFGHNESEAFLKVDSHYELSALSLDYNLSMIDIIKTIYYHDWKDYKDYYSVAWQRTYDDWIYSLNLYTNENNITSNDTDIFSGQRGIMLMVVYNY